MFNFKYIQTVFNFRLALILIFSLMASSAISGTILLMGIGTGTPGASPPPVGCGTGVIDLSTGCTQPMLGGL